MTATFGRQQKCSIPRSHGSGGWVVCTLSKPNCFVDNAHTNAIFADGHYIACHNILTPWRKDKPLTLEQTVANTIISFYHAHIEHVNSVLVCHNMF
jgi:hypothetical protein